MGGADSLSENAQEQQPITTRPSLHQFAEVVSTWAEKASQQRSVKGEVHFY